MSAVMARAFQRADRPEVVMLDAIGGQNERPGFGDALASAGGKDRRDDP